MNNSRFKFRAWHPKSRLLEAVMLEESYPGSAFKWLYEGQPIEIMQYTGLKDNKGVEIFEGDVVSMPIDGEFHNVEISFTVDRDFNGWEITPQHIEDGAVVVGNIHQHPELLK